MVRRKKDGNWHVQTQNVFLSALHFASRRIPIPEGEALALWFTELPSVVSAAFEVRGAEDYFTVEMTDGRRHEFSSAVRPQVLLEALILLTRLLQDQMAEESAYMEVNTKVFFIKKKRRRSKRVYAEVKAAVKKRREARQKDVN